MKLVTPCTLISEFATSIVPVRTQKKHSDILAHFRSSDFSSPPGTLPIATWSLLRPMAYVYLEVKAMFVFGTGFSSETILPKSLITVATAIIFVYCRNSIVPSHQYIVFYRLTTLKLWRKNPRTLGELPFVSSKVIFGTVVKMLMPNDIILNKGAPAVISSKISLKHDNWHHIPMATTYQALRCYCRNKVLYPNLNLKQEMQVYE